MKIVAFNILKLFLIPRTKINLFSIYLHIHDVYHFPEMSTPKGYCCEQLKNIYNTKKIQFEKN